MPAGELKIKSPTTGKLLDAYNVWGISMEQTSLSALMTPPPMKSVIENKYRSKHGKAVTNAAPRYDERDCTFAIHVNARTTDEFFSRYALFCEQVLACGELCIWTKYQPDTEYRFNYISCSQFSEFNAQYASFSLKLNEPDPSNRELDE